ncbi:MAG TPA: metallophosphoesterase [Phycisphaerae bacterium]|nr:metallophosphoesterase [Phycisphaerae bacterium]
MSSWIKRILAWSVFAVCCAATAHADDVFTVGVISDTQNYVDNNKPQPASLSVYLQQMQYLADHKADKNIAFATHVGDVVQHGDGTNGSAPVYGGPAEYDRAQQAMDILGAAGIPFGMSPGNHDYDNYSYTPPAHRPLSGSSMWQQYFGSSSGYFAGRPWYGGASDDLAVSPGLTSYQVFSAGGRTFLHISLEMEAGAPALAWAQAVVDAHPGLPTIVTTHSFLAPPDDDDDSPPLAVPAFRNDDFYLTGSPGGWNDAQGVWDQFIKINDQIFMVLCGHAWGATHDGVSKAENIRIDNNDFGHPVYQVLTDYQGNTIGLAGTPGSDPGGAGWMRFMEFNLTTNTIHFYTYSTLLDRYAGRDGEHTFNQDPAFSEFTLPLPPQVPQKWTFGVMSDTQWTCANDPAGENPDHVAVSIINQLNAQFIDAGVKFVIQVGDLTENGNDVDIATRATAAQALYDAGIGFFPMRGNHELYASPPNDYGIPAVRANFPQTRGLNQTFGARNFDSPTSVSAELDGMTYSFDFGAPGSDARFVIIDPWCTPTRRTDVGGYQYGYSIGEQQDWISDRLDESTRGAGHAFVFSHQPIMSENHQDCPFMGYTDVNPDMQNAFYASLQDNGVGYFIGGHDHMHQRSIIASPDGNSAVEELICASNSSKFYTPKSLTDPNWHGQKYRETSVSQELYTVGYHIFTIDGPRVTVSYYADDHGSWLSDASYPAGPSGAGTHITPMFNFVKRATWGYSLNGLELLVQQGQSYVLTDDTTLAVARGETGYQGTEAQILDGANGSTAQDYNGRHFTKTVDTGWAPIEAGLASDVFTLWGMTDLGTDHTDTFVLALSFNSALFTPGQLASGSVYLEAKDPNDGGWTNAVMLNVGGTPSFVFGPWVAGYPLGTYGIDLATQTAWAVLNNNGEFAVGDPSRGDCNCDGIVNADDVGAFVAVLLGGSPCRLENCDLNGDGVVDGRDIQTFITLLLS